MKKVLLGSLLVTGFLFAKHSDNSMRISSYEKEALNTQSPRVHTKARHSEKSNARTADRITKDKHTINAYVPYGK